MPRRKRERRVDFAQIMRPEDRAFLLQHSGAPAWLIARAMREDRPGPLRALGNPQRRRPARSTRVRKAEKHRRG